MANTPLRMASSVSSSTPSQYSATCMATLSMKSAPVMSAAKSFSSHAFMRPTTTMDWA